MAITPHRIPNEAGKNVLSALWRLSKGYRFCPWRSPYLRWRIETYQGWHAEQIHSNQFWTFVWRNRHELTRFLRWADRMASRS